MRLAPAYSQVNHHLACAAEAAVLPEVDTLPGAEHQLAGAEGDAQLGSGQCRLDVCRHVVGALQGVGVQGVIFRYQAIEPVFQVNTGTIVVVFLDQQGRRCVANEQGAQTLVHGAVADHLRDLGGEGVQPLAVDLDIQFLYQRLFNPISCCETSADGTQKQRGRTIGRRVISLNTLVNQWRKGATKQWPLLAIQACESVG